MNFVVLFVCVHVHLHTCEQVDRCAHVEVIGQLRYYPHGCHQPLQVTWASNSFPLAGVREQPSCPSMCLSMRKWSLVLQWLAESHPALAPVAFLANLMKFSLSYWLFGSPLLGNPRHFVCQLSSVCISVGWRIFFMYLQYWYFIVAMAKIL